MEEGIGGDQGEVHLIRGHHHQGEGGNTLASLGHLHHLLEDDHLVPKGDIPIQYPHLLSEGNHHLPDAHHLLVELGGIRMTHLLLVVHPFRSEMVDHHHDEHLCLGMIGHHHPDGGGMMILRLGLHLGEGEIVVRPRGGGRWRGSMEQGLEQEEWN